MSMAATQPAAVPAAAARTRLLLTSTSPNPPRLSSSMRAGLTALRARLLFRTLARTASISISRRSGCSVPATPACW